MSQVPQHLVLDAASSEHALRRAAETLARGEVVAVPTESLYVFAVRAERGGLQRLARVAGGEEHAALLLGAPSELENWTTAGAMVRRVVAKYWPGPLELLVPAAQRKAGELASAGLIAVRCPADSFATALARSAGFPLAVLDATRAPQDLLARDGLALVLDSGPARIGERPVTLELAPGRFRVENEGLIDAASLRRTAGLEIAFVCTGNTCRSPMAEGIARARLAERLGVAPNALATFGFGVRSMGVFASPGEAASPHAVHVLRESGIDISGHRAQATVPETIASLDRVYALTRSHLEALRATLPPGKDRHCELLDPQGRDIADPIGGPRSAYESTAAQIRRAIEARLETWA
jgi:protein-tyrosine phosphatase